jgi:hypothetical protein
MLRIIFTGLATCVLLLAAGLRFAREDAPQDVREALGEAFEHAVESAKQALPRPVRETAPEPAARPVASPPPEAAKAAPSPVDSKPAPAPLHAASDPSVLEPETVTEESISPLWSAPFVEAPQAGVGGAYDEESEPGRPREPIVAAAPSQDEWAGLIRRMLAIYERVGAVR